MSVSYNYHLIALSTDLSLQSSDRFLGVQRPPPTRECREEGFAEGGASPGSCRGALRPPQQLTDTSNLLGPRSNSTTGKYLFSIQ